ncbi:MAG: FtsX-like permease family protein, partial [Gemmatimonadetes bacterium]|nr:FtsX-like permease family protein [Gemmatimonadota bacterium]
IRREFGAMLEAIDLSSHPWAYSISAFPGTELDEIAIMGSMVFGGVRWMSSDMETMLQTLPGLRSRLILSALGVVLLFMAITSLSLVNLNVSRIMERASEIGVRKSFGATSLHLVRQFLVENLVLTMVGGLVGFCVSYGILEFRMGMTAGIPEDFGMNYRLFLAGLLFTMSFGLISGIYPAWRMSRLHPVEAVRGGQR